MLVEMCVMCSAGEGVSCVVLVEVSVMCSAGGSV